MLPEEIFIYCCLLYMGVYIFNVSRIFLLELNVIGLQDSFGLFNVI